MQDEGPVFTNGRILFHNICKRLYDIHKDAVRCTAFPYRNIYFVHACIRNGIGRQNTVILPSVRSIRRGSIQQYLRTLTNIGIGSEVQTKIYEMNLEAIDIKITISMAMQPVNTILINSYLRGGGLREPTIRLVI